MLLDILASACAILLAGGIAGGIRVVVKLSRRLDRQDDALGRIERETHLNGGKSLKDLVVRIEERQSATVEKLDEHLQDARYQMGRLDELASRQPQHTSVSSTYNAAPNNPPP